MVNIEHVLRDYTLVKQKFEIEKYVYSYFIADYQYKKEFFSRYFIWDISENEIYNHIRMVFLNQENFIEFERRLLEDTFFNSIGDERYNIYLILIVENNSELLKNSTIQNDFRYARKIILSVDQVEKFFVDTIPLQREREETYILNLVEKRKIINSLQQSVKKLKSIFYEEYVTKISLYRRNIKLTINNKKDMDLAQLIFSFPDTDMKDISQGYRKLKNNKSNAINPQSYKIEKIQSILIKNFRRFKQNCEISFARVNLLFGENGTGKTSLLEAIEFGITGTNSKSKGKKWNDAQVEVKCRNSYFKLVGLISQKNNMVLSDYWYDVKAETIEDFNLLFNRYNYFDTDWASAFAIGEHGRVPTFVTSNQEQVSLRMLQNFLGIDNIEEQKKNICDAYYRLMEYIDENIKYMDRKSVTKQFWLQNFMKDKYSIDSMLKESLKSREECQNEINVIEKQMEMKSLADTLSLHIKKIEQIFMLLISTNEYSELRTEGDEIVAVRSGTNETVPMSKMSTGQKVCLALAFMFELFLSNENTPNVIMLDEPVANLDDLHMLNLFDVLRRLSLTGTQIFFTTANPDVAKLFRRKFSFLKDDFRLYEIKESDQTIKISYSEFLPSEEKPIKTVDVC